MKSYAAGLFMLLSGGLLMAAIEEPDFEVVESQELYEIRRYQPFLVAEVTVDGSFSTAGNRAFRKLFAFISGDNVPADMMTMSQPDQGSGQKIEMTAPVINTMDEEGEAAERYTYQFVMPASFTMETLPRPTDDSVIVKEIPARYVAVHRYSGRATEDRYRKKEAALKNALIRDGVTMIGEPMFARYDGPFTLWFNRRNEVMVEIAMAEENF